MASNAGFLVGWTRAFPGREGVAVAKFPEYLGYLQKQQSEGRIESFEPVLLGPHGGDLNGFVLVRGDAEKLDALRRSDAFLEWSAFGVFYLQGFGITEVYLNESLGQQMARFAKLAAG